MPKKRTATWTSWWRRCLWSGPVDGCSCEVKPGRRIEYERTTED